MTGHPTLGPARTAVVCSGAADDANATAAFADLVCADHELLRAEFDAIITANFPEPAEHPRRCDPAVSVATMTDPGPQHRTAGPGHRRRPGSGVAATAHPQPRERGPPPARPTGPPAAFEPSDSDPAASMSSVR